MKINRFPARHSRNSLPPTMLVVRDGKYPSLIKASTWPFITHQNLGANFNTAYHPQSKKSKLFTVPYRSSGRGRKSWRNEAPGNDKTPLNAVKDE